MALPKKGQLHQILVPMVDSVDFATPEGAITASDFNSGATRKYFGWNTGSSAAVTSGTVSKIASLVTSGVFRLTLKTTENNFDQMMVIVTKTGCARQIIPWSNVDSDESDILSAIAIGNSRVLLVQSMASDVQSALTIGNSRILLNQSRISDIASYLVVMSGVQSDVLSALVIANSRILLNQSRLSDMDSRLASELSDIASALSNINSIATASPTASDIASKVWADTTGAATASRVLLTVSRVSDVQSKLSDVESNLLSLLTTTGVQLNASSLSDLRSAIAAITVSLDASNISDIASAVVAALPITSMVSDIQSAVAIANSRILVNQSVVSDIYSRVLAGVEVGASSISDVVSAVWAATTRTLSASAAIKKNTAYSNFQFLMVDSDGQPKTGLTITAERLIDGGSFEACANAATEKSAGMYAIDFATTDVNGDTVTFKFSATGAETTYITVKTAP